MARHDSRILNALSRIFNADAEYISFGPVPFRHWTTTDDHAQIVGGIRVCNCLDLSHAGRLYRLGQAIR